VWLLPQTAMKSEGIFPTKPFHKGKGLRFHYRNEVERGGIPELAIAAPVLTGNTGSPIGVIVNFIHLSEFISLYPVSIIGYRGQSLHA